MKGMCGQCHVAERTLIPHHETLGQVPQPSLASVLTSAKWKQYLALGRGSHTKCIQACEVFST